MVHYGIVYYQCIGFMVELDEIISVVPKHSFKVPGTRDPSRALYEKTINFVKSTIQLKNFVDGIS